MKISFETNTATHPELMMVRDIIDTLLEQMFKTTTVEFPLPSEPDNGDPSGADRVYFAARVPIVGDETHLVATTPIIVKVDEPNTDFLNEGASDEYEPDDEDESGSPGDLVVPVVPMPEYEPSYCIPSPPPPVAAIVQVLPLPPQPETVITVSPPPPPPSDPTAPGIRDPRDNPFRGHSDATAPTQPVSPPPPPQESAQVSTGANEGMSDDLDSDGKPWDATIHSESRARNVDGTWRKRRVNKNVEVKAAIAGLEAITPNSVPAPPTRKMVRTFVRINGAQELIAAPEDASDAELSLITGKPTTRETASDPHPTIVAEPVYPSVPPPPPAAPPVVKTAAPGAPAGTWPELMERVTKYFGAQKITSVDLAEICKTFNIGSVQECYAQPHLIPLVSSAIDAKAATK